MFTNKTFLSSLLHALSGVRSFFKEERNGRIQLVIALLVIITGVVLKVSASEWIALLLCIGIVVSLEMLNSALEKLCDMVHPGYHRLIKLIKDTAAGAVFVSSVFSAIIGTIILLPKILVLL